MAKAPAPSRTTDTSTLNFGLVSIPVALYTATEKVSVSRSMFVKDTDHRVGNKTYDKETGADVGRDDIEHKMETEYGFVFVEDHEIERLFTLTPHSMRVLEFQPIALWSQGKYVPKSLYYVGPGKLANEKQPSPVVKKAFVMLLKAMEEKNAMAVVEWTSRGVPKPGLLFPDGTLWQVHHEEEVRERRPFPEADVSEAELTMAGSLIDTLWSDEPHTFTDERSALIKAFATEKASKQEFGKEEEPEVETPTAKQQVDGIMAMLQASIDAAKAEKEAEAS